MNMKRIIAIALLLLLLIFVMSCENQQQYNENYSTTEEADSNTNDTDTLDEDWADGIVNESNDYVDNGGDNSGTEDTSDKNYTKYY